MAWSPMMREDGPADMITTRSARAMASSRSWVTKRTALRLGGPQFEQQVAHDLPRLGVEGAEGLVHEEYLGVADQHLGEADALPLPARELVGIAVAEGGEADALEPGLCALQRLGAGNARHLEADGDVVARRLPGHHRVLLEEVAGVPIEAGKALAQHERLARRWGEQSRSHVEQRGLAAAGRADDGHELVRADGQIGGGNRRIGAAIGERKADRHAAEAYGRGAAVAGARGGGLTLGGCFRQRACVSPGCAPLIGSTRHPSLHLRWRKSVSRGCLRGQDLQHASHETFTVTQKRTICGVRVARHLHRPRAPVPK